MDQNPYQPPAAEVGTVNKLDVPRSRRGPLLVSGRRWLVTGFLIMVFSTVARSSPADTGLLLLGFGGFISAVVGIVRMAKGLTYPLGLRVVLAIGFFVPFLNIAIAIYLLVRTAATLRQLAASPTSG